MAETWTTNSIFFFFYYLNEFAFLSPQDLAAGVSSDMNWYRQGKPLG